MYLLLRKLWPALEKLLIIFLIKFIYFDLKIKRQSDFMLYLIFSQKGFYLTGYNDFGELRPKYIF